MTFWAKMLTIIALVLSIAFAAMSAVIFAKREDYRGQLAAAQRQYDADKKKAQDTITRLTGDLTAKDTELAQKNTELKSRELQLGTVTSELDQKRRDVTQLQSTVSNEQSNVQKLVALTDGLTKRNDTLLAENGNLRKENGEMFTKLSAEQNRANDLQKANAQLKGENDTLVARLSTANDTIKLNEEVFAELGKRNIEARPIIAGFNALPDVKGKVVTVDPESNLVVLNIGRKQGVRKNFDFTVFRDDKFVGTVNVFDVQDDLCAARIVTRKMAMQRGDNAWTRLQ